MVGTGYWGRNHARVYKELSVEGLVGRIRVCDVVESRVSALSRNLGVEWTTDYHEIIEDRGIRAVSIVTPSGMHSQMALEFMEAGKDVLVEKPMTLNAEEARGLVGVAAANGSVLMVGHIFRYHPAARELKRRIDLGELGQVLFMFGNRLDFGAPRRDMGVVFALGVHELDLFCYLLDCSFPKSIQAASSSIYQQGIEETAMIVMDFGHAKGYALESWLLPVYGKRRDLAVVGGEKSARVDFSDSQVLTMFDSRIIEQEGVGLKVETEGTHAIPLPFAEPLKEEIKHFLGCVSARTKPLTDGVVGWRAVAMAEAALRSTRTGRIVSFGENGPIAE